MLHRRLGRCPRLSESFTGFFFLLMQILVPLPFLVLADFASSVLHKFYMVNWPSGAPNASLWDTNCGCLSDADYSVWRLVSQSVSVCGHFCLILVMIDITIAVCHHYQCCFCSYLTLFAGIYIMCITSCLDMRAVALLFLSRMAS